VWLTVAGLGWDYNSLDRIHPLQVRTGPERELGGGGQDTWLCIGWYGHEKRNGGNHCRQGHLRLHKRFTPVGSDC
jgi:hypothetical protein